MPTPAERDRSAPAQAEFLAILVHDGEVTFYAQRAVIQNYDFCSSQGFLRLQNRLSILVTNLKITARRWKHKALGEKAPPKTKWS